MRRKFMMNLGSTNWGGGITLNINDLNEVLGPSIPNDYMERPILKEYYIYQKYIQIAGRIFVHAEDRYSTRNIPRLNPWWFEFDEETGLFIKGGDLPDLDNDDGINDKGYDKVEHHILDSSCVNFKNGILYVMVVFSRYGDGNTCGYKIYRLTNDSTGIQVQHLSTYNDMSVFSKVYYVHGNYFYKYYNGEVQRSYIDETSIGSGEILTVPVSEIPNYVNPQTNAWIYIDSGMVRMPGIDIDRDIARIEVNYFGENLFPSVKTVSLSNIPLMMKKANVGHYLVLPLEGNKFVMVSSLYAKDNGETGMSFGQVLEFDPNKSTFNLISSGFLPPFEFNLSYEYMWLSWGNKYKFMYNVYTGSTNTAEYHKTFNVWAE